MTDWACSAPDCTTPESPKKTAALCSICYRKAKKMEEPDGDQATAEAGADGGGDHGPGGPVAGEEVAAAPPAAPVVGPYAPGERAPTAEAVPASSSVPARRERRSIFGRRPRTDSTEPQVLPPTREKRPGAAKSGRRQSGAETLEQLYGAVGGLFVQTPNHQALGMAMRLQAPVAGEMLDQAVAGSIVDKLAIQRVVKARGRFDLLAAVLGTPLIVGMIEQHPERAPMLIPTLRSQISSSLPLMVPALKKVKAREEAAAKAAEELFEGDDTFDHTRDPAEQIIEQIFGVPYAVLTRVPAPQPTEEPVNHE